MSPATVWRWKLALFVGYVGVTLAVGEVFPFSPFAMYADLNDRREGAVPVVLVDGVPADVRYLDGFVGLDVQRMRPDGLPCSLGYLVDEMILHVQARLQPAPPAGVRTREVVFAYKMIRVQDDGTFQSELIERTRGIGWAAP